MIKNINVTVPLDATIDEVFDLAIKKSGIPKGRITGRKIKKRSVDARYKKVQFNYCISLFTGNEQSSYKEHTPVFGKVKAKNRPVIVGMGPAGLFCAYKLAKHGYKPILIERGGNIKQRVEATSDFALHAKLDPNTNIQFGEGGAGTFSDGKLTTRINDPLCEAVLHTFVEFGAPEEIQYLGKPHIGTDILRDVILNIRKNIIQNGGTVKFNSLLEQICIKNGAVSSISVNGNYEECDVLVLCTGHSARDTYRMLYDNKVFMEPKAFAAGVRIEHKREFIDKAQYGDYAGHPALGAADYRLAYNGDKRSCYSFCMCPGGYVVAAASEEDTVVVNGMSNHARNAENSNSALVVNVTQNDYDGVLGGIEFQRKLERAAFSAKNPYFAPVQNTTDFLASKQSINIKNIDPTYPIGYETVDLNKILPKFIAETLRDGIAYFDSAIRGFSKNSVLTGVETRTSAPVRITRGEDMQSINVKGLYPVGEGAGYAGGIMSAAIDGLKAADKIMSLYAPF